VPAPLTQLLRDRLVGSRVRFAAGATGRRFNYVIQPRGCWKLLMQGIAARLPGSAPRDGVGRWGRNTD